MTIILNYVILKNIKNKGLNMNSQELFKEVDIRKQKINDIIAEGKLAYADKYDRTHTLEAARTLPDGEKVRVCGRVVSKRMMGKLGFFHIADVKGDVQISISRNEIDEEDFKWFKSFVDNADFVGVEGEIYHTHTGEFTVRCHNYTLLSKTVLPLPEKFHGLSDTELKYRQRYLDIIRNDESKTVFLTRSKLLTFIRNYLDKNEFVEVETPILQNAVCGASAKPFMTRHNALDKDLNLRIAPETFLKQIISSGFDRVFEIGKNFRNEGMDRSHLQEFTMIEWYASYWNFEDNIAFFQDFIKAILMHIKGTTKITYQEKEYDFGGEWNRINYVEKMNEILDMDILSVDRDGFVNHVVSTGKLPASEFEHISALDKCIDLTYKRLLRPTISQPTILFNYPNISPLARPNDANPKCLDMFQVLVEGEEICKAYSELVNPKLQRDNFNEQVAQKNQGDEEAMELDEDFLLSMEHGMPPISGLGMGIDRLMCIITDQPSIRDVVFFPLMK